MSPHQSTSDHPPPPSAQGRRGLSLVWLALQVVGLSVITLAVLSCLLLAYRGEQRLPFSRASDGTFQYGGSTAAVVSIRGGTATLFGLPIWTARTLTVSWLLPPPTVQEAVAAIEFGMRVNGEEVAEQWRQNGYPEVLVLPAGERFTVVRPERGMWLILLWSVAAIAVIHLVGRSILPALRLRQQGARFAAARCVHCGYPARGVAKQCPECGKA